jgi:hypothetical protein
MPATAAPELRRFTAELYVFGQQLDGDPHCWPGTAAIAGAIAGAAAGAGVSGGAPDGRSDPPSLHQFWPDGLSLLDQSGIDASRLLNAHRQHNRYQDW